MINEPAKSPCISCPYRLDAPSGLWHEEEYAKLPTFDDPPGPVAVFMCHQQDERLCAGWVGCHDTLELLGPRVALMEGRMTMETYVAMVDYETHIPLFDSGAEAAEHGLREYAAPPERTDRLRRKLIKTKDVRLG